MPNIILTVIIAILVFGVIIIIHELGHFLVAKANGVKINEFSFGMGPALFGFTKGETRYSVRAFPLGGYVSMEGEDEDSEDERSSGKKKWWQKLLIVVAGAVMNLILGLIILMCLTFPNDAIGTTTLAQFNEGSQSQSAGLQIDDKIVKINNSAVHIDMDIVYELMLDHDGKVDMVVERDGERVEVPNVQFAMTQDEDGNQFVNIDFKVYAQENSFFKSLERSFYWTGGIVKVVWRSLIDLVTGNFSLNQLGGPVRVADELAQASSAGWDSLLLMVAFITINVGVFNLLPLPALDGGRLIFIIIEGVRGKPVPAKYEGWVHAAGFILLILLMVLVTFNDIVNLFRG